jgi:hypothetical protein
LFSSYQKAEARLCLATAYCGPSANISHDFT